MGSLRQRISLFVRFFGVGAVNTAFGFGLYSVLVLLGLNLYIAQIIAQCCGVTFNYFMYRRHVFTDSKPFIGYYIVAYGLNYLIGVVLLYLAHRAIQSPVLAGLVATIVAALINFFILKNFVFKGMPQTKPVSLEAPIADLEDTPSL